MYNEEWASIYDLTIDYLQFLRQKIRKGVLT